MQISTSLEKLADESAFDENHFARPLFDTARLKCRGMVEEGAFNKIAGGFVSATLPSIPRQYLRARVVHPASPPSFGGRALIFDHALVSARLADSLGKFEVHLSPTPRFAVFGGGAYSVFPSNGFNDPRVDAGATDLDIVANALEEKPSRSRFCKVPDPQQRAGRP